MIKQSINRALIGASAVLGICVLIALLPGLLALVIEGDIIAFERGVGLSFFISGYFLLILIVWGLPLHAVLSYFKIKSIYAYLMIGFLAAPLVVTIFKPFGGTPFAQSMSLTAVFGVLGALAGAIFWSIAVRERYCDRQ